MSDTITFERDGKEHVAVVSSVPKQPVADALVVEANGVRYSIAIAMGQIPGHPGVGFIARPIAGA